MPHCISHVLAELSCDALHSDEVMRLSIKFLNLASIRTAVSQNVRRVSTDLH